jgi:hypothetical protein
MDEQQDNGVVVVPTDQEGVDAQDAVDDAGVSVVHVTNINKKWATAGPFLSYKQFL